MNTIVRGRFADMLPPRPKTLRDLMIEAIEASEALGKYYELPIPDAHEIMRLEAAASEAEQALKDHLLTEYGATTADLKRLAVSGVLV